MTLKQEHHEPVTKWFEREKSLYNGLVAAEHDIMSQVYTDMFCNL